MKINNIKDKWVSTVEDIDCGDLTDTEQKKVFDLLATRKVVIFKKQNLTNEQLKTFASVFGFVWDRNKEKYSGLEQSVNTGHQDNFVEVVSESGLLKKGIIPWHIDLTHFPSQLIPNRLLYAVELEGAPAGTRFIDTVQGYKLLGPGTKNFLRQSVALCKAPYDTPWKAIVRRPALNWHPCYRDWALTCDNLFTIHIEGLDQDYKDWIGPIIANMQTEETTYEHEWELGDLMIYDNWSTMHYRGSFEGKRKLKRLTWDQDWYRYGEPNYV